jgi:transketolase
MLNDNLKLKNDLFDAKDQAATRDGFGKGAVEAGKKDPNVVVLCADLKESTRAEWFEKEFPDRFVELGVAEQNMAAVASGMSAVGKVPFIASYAAFNPGRNYEQIRTTVALNEANVKVCGMHAGVSVGPDGATHQMLEDMTLMRALPNMVVISPCDAEEARKATIAAATHVGPVYLRFAREKTPVMTTEETPFEIGKSNVMWTSEKPDVAVFATGPLVFYALTAAKELEKEISVSVINVHSIKPLDKKIVEYAKGAGAVVTVEEHQVAGGLGSAIAELLANEAPLPMEFVGVHDRFGQSGIPEELYREYGMDVPAIIRAIQKAKGRK